MQILKIALRSSELIKKLILIGSEIRQTYPAFLRRTKPFTSFCLEQYIGDRQYKFDKTILILRTSTNQVTLKVKNRKSYVLSFYPFKSIYHQKSLKTSKTHHGNPWQIHSDAARVQSRPIASMYCFECSSICSRSDKRPNVTIFLGGHGRSISGFSRGRDYFKILRIAMGKTRLREYFIIQPF